MREHLPAYNFQTGFQLTYSGNNSEFELYYSQIGKFLTGCQKICNVYSHYSWRIVFPFQPVGKNKVINAKNCHKNDISPL